MVSLRPYLQSLLKALPAPPGNQNDLHGLVKQTLQDAKAQTSADNWKNQWEYLLRDEIFRLAGTEGAALNANDVAYYDELRDKLDIVLIFTEQEACEQTFPFLILQDLLETQTIASCSQIFSWIEDRASRLTEGMVPQKGKALILLRTLNELLRRLSKMGSTTIFCGRILTFLSGVFPLGERSGVNLRGEYGPTWEGVNFTEKPNLEDQDVAMDSAKEETETQEDQMQVDESKESKPVPSQSPTEKEDFYNTFWSLQLYFSKPTEFANKGALEVFRESVNKVIPVIKEATAKERAMMGSRNITGTGSSLKRKRDQDPEESNVTEYFFAKFLTSPDLVDLEIADTHFRRQFLFQLLILLHHLLTFTKEAKESWATLRNRSLQMDFTLEPEDAQWVQEFINKVTEELRQTTPNGRQFSDTVTTILERERNWVKWKNDICVPFDKEPWSEDVDRNEVGLFQATRKARADKQSPPQPWRWSLGTEPLTEIWTMGYRDLYDLQNPFQPGEVKDFLKRLKHADARIIMRRRQLTNAAERVAQAQAQAAAKAVAATTPPTPAPKVVEVAPLPAPKPIAVAALGNSSLHPSLPPKPGSPVKPSPSQESVKVAGSSLVTVTTPSLPVPTPTPAPPPPADDQINKWEEDKQRLTWLALRTAREQHLQHFAKIGTGDLELLCAEIDKDKGDRERNVRGESVEETGEPAGDHSQKVEMES